FYGTGEIINGSYEVDLSSFAVTSLEVENPEGYRMNQMIKRLTRWFQLDMERYSVRVDLLYWKPLSPGIWELAHVRTTTAWIKWLLWCRHHGTEFVMLVQPCEKEVYESSEV